MWTIFIQCNEPKNAHQQILFHRYVTIHRHVSVVSATFIKVSHQITQCTDNYTIYN